MRELVIAGRRIADDSDCFVIADVSHNHQGSVDLAREMFRVAKECGVDAVKLQRRSKTQLFTAQVYTAPPESKYADLREYAAMRAKRELTKEGYLELRKYANELGLVFMVTPFDFESVDFLADVGLDAIKVASGDAKNVPLLEYVSNLNLPTIVSTGGAGMEDVERAHSVLSRLKRQFCLLQCTSTYPCPDADMNLRVIQVLRERFPDTIIGLSSHHPENIMEPVAYALGARIVEKHFTLSRKLGLGDHAISLEPRMLRDLVNRLRATKLALGDGSKRELTSEATGILRLGKKLVAAHPLSVGHTLRREDISIKGPGDGIPPCRIEDFIGRRVTQIFIADGEITYENTAPQVIRTLQQQASEA